MVRIYLGDLTHETVTVSSDTMPLNIGFLAAYLNKQFHDDLEIHLFKSPRELLEKIKEQLPDVLGLSNYCWNFELSHFIFQHVKARKPNVLTVMGGPNFPKVSREQHAFLAGHPAIDFYIFQEGELSFCDLLKRMMDNGMEVEKIKREPVKGCYFFSPETRTLVSGDLYPRIKTLEDLPSPYLTGLMDKFFGAKLNPFIQTNRGCPFTCTFCHEGEKYYSTVNSFSIARVTEELDYISSRLQGQSVLSIADSNFAMYKQDLEICKKIRVLQDSKGYPKYINVTTGKNRPDMILEAIKVLEKGTVYMSASVQSLNSGVLENIKRKNIEWSAYIDIQHRLHEMDPDYMSISEIIVPLPGETKETFFESIEKLIGVGIDKILPYTLMMLYGTELSSNEEREKYNYLTRFRIIPRNFGDYEGHKCMEIEEVGVAHRDMSFGDYLLCRKMALLIVLVYNDKGFKELFKYFKEREVPFYQYLLYCFNNMDQASPELKNIFDDFLAETKEELWENREALQAFFNEEANIKKLMEGEIGGNLLQKYWAKAVIFNFELLADYVFDAALKFILQSPERTEEGGEEIVLELEEIKKYILMRRNNLLDADHLMNEERVGFEFDIRNWLEDQNNRTLKTFRGKKIFSVSIPVEQRDLLKNLLQQYGTSCQAVGKISTRVNVGNLERHFDPVA